MKKQCFVFSLLLVLVLAACSKDDLQSADKVDPSEPQITYLPIEIGDSLIIKGFNTCYALNVYKGTLPELVVKESGYDKSYLYYIHKAMVKVEEKEDKMLFPVTDMRMGYSTPEMTDIGNYYSSIQDQNGRIFLEIYTYLIHLTKEQGGEDMDIWYPCSPKELEWTAFEIERKNN